VCPESRRPSNRTSSSSNNNSNRIPSTDTIIRRRTPPWRPCYPVSVWGAFPIFPRFSNIFPPAHSLPIPAIVSRIENLPKAPNMCAPIFRFSDFPLFPAHSGLSHFRPRCLRTALKCPTLDIDLYTNIRRRICIFISKYRLAGALLKVFSSLK